MRFFFYGTLIDGSANPVARDVHGKLRALGPAIARGRLFAIADPRGWYPALVAGPGEVHGMLYESIAGFGQAELARLDAYEDFDRDDPAHSLYLRKRTVVRDRHGLRLTAHAYRYNRSVPPGARPIRCGNFRAWLLENGLKALGAAPGDANQA